MLTAEVQQDHEATDVASPARKCQQLEQKPHTKARKIMKELLGAAAELSPVSAYTVYITTSPH